MIALAFVLGLAFLPASFFVFVGCHALFTRTRRWSGCASCAYWTTSTVPIVRWAQWRLHRFWTVFRPRQHAIYGAAHPPRREPEDPISTSVLIPDLDQASMHDGTEK